MPDLNSENAIISRDFDLEGAGKITAEIWAAFPLPDSVPSLWKAPFRITGLSRTSTIEATGLDSLAATMSALHMISTLIYTSPEYKAGRITLYGSRDLFLPVHPGNLAGLEGYEAADIVAKGGGTTIFTVPGDPFPWLGLAGNRVHNFIENLKFMRRALRDDPDHARRGLRWAIDCLGVELKWYEAVCDQAGIELAYVRKKKPLKSRTRSRD